MVTKTDYGLIKPAQLEEEMRSSYLDYAMSVIVARALPDVRDGLKPVQRRILYAMHDLGIRSDTPYKKSARIVGEVLGKYHPHGESAVYDAMVRMAQPFSMRLPLVDGQGNFGSIDNDPPAAQRYTEARLSKAAEQMLLNLDQETVDFVDNFDGTLQEPSVLPSRLPNLLVNGASGIAVGMATNIPPHNCGEVCDGIIKLIDNPDATVEQLMKYVKGPDFATGAMIMGTEGTKNAFATGRGQIMMRAKADVEEMKRGGKNRIVVTELPYQVNKAALVEKIATLAKTRHIEGISEIRDESDRHGMRIVVELRSGTQPLIVLNKLYKLTPMQSAFSANMLALVDGNPRVINLKQALQYYIEFRQEIIVRRTRFELKKAKERAHILEGLRIALEFLDEIIQLIRNAKDVESARTALMERYSLDTAQAQAILDMQLRRLAGLERERIENEYQELLKLISELESLLADPKKVLEEIKKETREVKRRFGDERRTEICEEVKEFSRADLEAHEQVVVTLSQGGYIKRIPATTYRSQHRGGKGVTSMITRDDDPVEHILVVDTHHILLFFTDRGRVLSLTGYELRADTSRNTRGVPIGNVIPLGESEEVNAVIGVPTLQRDNQYLIMVTKKGVIKRTALSQIASIRKAGLIIMNLKRDDALVKALLCEDGDDLIIITRKGMSIRFAISEVPVRLRAAGGVKGIQLKESDNVVSMDKVVPDSKLLVISKKGYGKLTALSSYRRQGRGGMGIKTFNITNKTGLVAAAEVIDDSNEVYVVSEQAQVLRTSLSEIRSTGRATQGVSIFKPEEGDAVASIACVSDKDLPAAAEKPGSTRTREEEAVIEEAPEDEEE